MLDKLKNRRHSIFSRLLLPMLLIAVAEMAALFLTLTLGGAFSSLETNALDALDERTQNKHQPLQQELRTIWNSLDNISLSLSSSIEDSLRFHGATLSDMKEAPGLNSEIIRELAPQLISHFRQLDTTGIMLILDGQGITGRRDSYAGIYLRDSEPDTDSSDNRDIILQYGLPTLSDELGTPLARDWKSTFTFSDPATSEFFFKPCNAAKSGHSVDPQYYGVWCGPFRMVADDPDLVLTYTVPVLTSTGDVLGVLGIELSQSYLSNRFNAGEFARTMPGCYVLGLLEDDTHIRTAVTSGQMYRQHFRHDRTILTINERLDRNSVTLTGTLSGETVYATMEDIVLYPTSALFGGDHWVLLGMQSEDQLLAPAYRFLTLMVVGGAVALMVCVFVAIVTSRGITTPISRMVRQVRTSADCAQLHLDATGILEIDDLGDSILRLSRDVHESAARLSTILRLTGMAVGVFEIKLDSETAWCSTGFFQLLNCDEDASMGENLPKTRLYQIMREKLTDQVEPDVWRLTSESGKERYIRRLQIQHRYDLLGAIMDVTAEIEDRRRIEHERDYDILTGLLNRRAFSRITEDLFQNKANQLGVAAMVMMDLDNLKFVNDVYGHDCGDDYIQSFGEALVVFDQYGKCVRGRRSGDEFYILLYGFESKAACADALSRGWQEIMQQGIQLTDGQFYRFRCSGGIAMYPDDATDMNTLVHYADFAMYKVKQGSKGVLEYFDRSVYTEEAFLINAREALNHLIDKHLISYAFQPIVNAHTGEVYGYELLMRPDVPELRNPASTIRLAKAQGQLHHIERLTWFEGLRSAKRMIALGKMSRETHIFINSIANQVLDQEEEEHVLALYQDLLPNVMLEVTEGEDNNMAYTSRKLNFIREHGGQVAIDDYGTGYNSEMALMLIDADCVKIDISFIRNVDSNPDKQQLVRNLISYARRKNMLVLGEGVETREEMETLISFGIDYLQGYYLGRPAQEPEGIPEHVRQEILDAARTPPQC